MGRQEKTLGRSHRLSDSIFPVTSMATLCQQEMATEEGKVLSQRRNEVPRKQPLMLTTFCDFPGSTTSLLKKPQRMHFHRKLSTVHYFSVFAHRYRAQMCVSGPGLSPRREVALPPASILTPSPSSGDMYQVQNTGTIAVIPNCVYPNNSFLDHL